MKAIKHEDEAEKIMNVIDTLSKLLHGKPYGIRIGFSSERGNHYCHISYYAGEDGKIVLKRKYDIDELVYFSDARGNMKYLISKDIEEVLGETE